MLELHDTKGGRILEALKSPRPQPVVTKAEADWFESLVERSQKGVFSEVVTLTPERARLILGGNDKNRVINNAHVQRLASDIEAGSWEMNGESIKVAKTGQLCDGQHRAMAVLVANKPIKTVMTFGLDYETRLTTDQNKAKGVGDYLSMEANVTNATICAAAARILLANRLGMRYGDGGGRSQLTKTRIRQEYFDNQKAIDAAVTLVASNSTARVVGGPSTLAAVLVILRRISPSADDFILKVIKGNDLSDGDAVLAARDRMIRDPRMPVADRIVLLTKAFEAWMAGRETRKIIVKSRLETDRKRVLEKKKAGRQS